MSSEAISPQALTSLLQSLAAAANAIGYEAHFNLAEPDAEIPVKADEDAAQTKNRHKRELAFLQQKVFRPDGLYPLYAGNHAAMYEESIVALSPVRDIALNIAAAKLGLDPEKILVVPICVTDGDSEMHWLNARRQSGMD
jgi:hypothetical protein